MRKESIVLYLIAHPTVQLLNREEIRIDGMPRETLFEKIDFGILHD